MIDLDALFMSGTPLIDVRAPVEWGAGHFPTSVNLPLLEDEERRQVGICHRTHGPDAAIQLGHELIQGEIKVNRIQRWTSFLAKHPGSMIYCQRGGLRSRISTDWIQNEGVKVERIEGGYKALRNHLLLRMSELCESLNFLVLGGKTGSGKTEFLKECGSPFLDLEAHACHRGSSFGSLGPQPAQATFENSLSTALLKLPFRSPVLVEDESVMIGSLVVPESLFLRMKKSPLLVLETPFSERVLNLTHEYVLNRLRESHEEPKKTMDFFVQNLKRIQKKLGGLRHSELERMIRVAFESREFTHPATHFDWVAALLRDYYDPLYERSLEKSKDRIIIRGSRNDLASKLSLP